MAQRWQEKQPSPAQRLKRRPCRHHAEVEAVVVVAEAENPVARRALCCGGAMVSPLRKVWLLLLLARLLLRPQQLLPH